MSDLTIVQKHQQNFDTVLQAAAYDRLALLDCYLAVPIIPQPVAVIIALSDPRDRTYDDEYDMVPFAMFFNGNPYEMLRAPLPGGGYEPDPRDN